MKNYRLKKEAVIFFKETHATRICSLDIWEGLGVDITALEEVGDPYLSYGIKQSENSSTLGGWNEKGYRFEFTIHFPSVSFYECDSFSNGKLTRELMNRIQNEINNYYVQFSEKDKTN
jgi:hypothetical protein